MYSYSVYILPCSSIYLLFPSRKGFPFDRSYRVMYSFINFYFVVRPCIELFALVSRFGPRCSHPRLEGCQYSIFLGILTLLVNFMTWNTHPSSERSNNPQIIMQVHDVHFGVYYIYIYIYLCLYRYTMF